MIERLIGIDFGTSTTVVKVKSYQESTPIGGRNSVEYVHFNNHETLPTLVYKTEKNTYLFGYEAENAAIRGELYQNFKLSLIHKDREKKNEAIQYTGMFLAYVHNAYQEQKSHYPKCDLETTYISYPAKWPEETRTLMVELTKKAGFQNVIGLPEPTAAIHLIMLEQADRIKLNEQETANMLIVDMGAGTTDLVLCRYAPFETEKIKVLNTWPKAECDYLFGGKEIDDVLCDYVKDYVAKCGLPNTSSFRSKYLDKCKRWKEVNVSPIFNKEDGIVQYCGFVDALLSMFDIEEEFPPFSRKDFEKMLSSYLIQFPKIIKECLEDIQFDADKVDYVILTGGHSQWYFIKEMLEGKMEQYGAVNLLKVREDPSRIIRLALPQETVALGLVYQKIQPEIPTHVKQKKLKYCERCGKQNPSRAIFCGYCGGNTFTDSLEEYKYCGGCGKRVPMSQAFCGYCGYRF